MRAARSVVYVAGGALVGMALMVVVLVVAAEPVQRGVDLAIATARQATDYLMHGDDWWRDDPAPGPR